MRLRQAWLEFWLTSKVALWSVGLTRSVTQTGAAFVRAEAGDSAFMPEFELLAILVH